MLLLLLLHLNQPLRPPLPCAACPALPCFALPCPRPGYQALLFAPTELLATQHYATLNDIIESMPLAQRPRTALLIGSCRASEKKTIKDQLADGSKDILISTHVRAV